MKDTSAHFQPVKEGSERHNKREKELDYVKKDLTKQNEYWQSSSQAERLDELKKLVKAKTKRAMQKKATPIREAVVVIDEKTTMDDLQKLAAAYRKEFGIDCFQIAIHRDEGHMVDGEWKSNLHAHMVFDWVDHKTGKSIKLMQGTRKSRSTGEVFTRDDMSRLQDITAEVLHMGRGKSSDRKHLSAIQYKNDAQGKQLIDAEQRLKEAQKAIEALDNEIEEKKERNKREKKDLDETADNIIKARGAILKYIKSLDDRKKLLQGQIEALQSQIKQLTPKTMEEEKQALIEAIERRQPSLATAAGAMIDFVKNRQSSPTNEQRNAVNKYLKETFCDNANNVKEVIAHRQIGVQNIAIASISICSPSELRIMDKALEVIAKDGPSIEPKYDGVYLVLSKDAQGQAWARAQIGNEVTSRFAIDSESYVCLEYKKSKFSETFSKNKVLDMQFGDKEAIQRAIRNNYQQEQTRGSRLKY